MLMPAVGWLVSRVDPRFMIAFGFTIVSASLFHMAATLYPGIDFRTAVILRMCQAAGLAFLFVPINTLSYAGMPPERSNSVSGIINLSRNMGGDIGIAIATTLVARRSQTHQVFLSAHANLSAKAWNARIEQMSRVFERGGSPSAVANRRALAALYREVVNQATTLAYLDVLRFFGLVAALMIPLVLLVRRPSSHGPPVGH